MENKKNIIIGIFFIIFFALGMGIAYFFPKQNVNEEKTVVVTEENTQTPPQSEQSEAARTYTIDKLLMSTGEGSVHLSGNIEEVKESEQKIVIALPTGGSEKLLRTLKIDGTTELYTVSTASTESIQKIVLTLSDFKQGDFINVLVKEEDDIQNKDVFQALDICLTKVTMKNL